MVGYRPSSFGGVHVAVNFDVPETGAADEQVVDARFGDALLLQLGAWIALLTTTKMNKLTKKNDEKSNGPASYWTANCW